MCICLVIVSIDALDSNFCEHLEDRFSTQSGSGDIWSGEEYRKLIRPGSFLSNKWNISFTLNSDGISIFKTTSRGSLWPVYLVVNELPPKLRYCK